MSVFCDNLKRYRRATGLKQSEMAQILGMTDRGYRNYEIGAREPNLTDLVKIADRLNVSLDDLVGRTFARSQDALVDAEQIL